MRRLSQLQAAFTRYLVVGDNEDVVADHVSGTLPAALRLEVYRNAYHTRLHDALAHDFPALRAVAGDRVFGALCTAYLAECRSIRPSLRFLGQRLPGWLRRHGHARVQVDVAALEWAVLHAFDAADASPIEAAAFAGLPAERWPRLRVTLHPSIRLLAVESNARALWAATRTPGAMPEPREGREWLVVWRSRRGPAVEGVTRESFSVLSALGRGETFAAVCEALTAWVAPREIAMIAAACLHAALQRGWVAGWSAE